MRAGILPFVALAIFNACAEVSNAQLYSASGTLTDNGKTVRLESAAAIWDRAGNQLQIGLFPFPINPQDIETMRNSAPLFVAVEKQSPDPGKWSSPPFAVLEIEFAPATLSMTRERVTHYALHVSWLDEMNNTRSVSRNLDEEFAREIVDLSGTLQPGGSLRVAIKGTDVFRGGSRLSWDFRVHSRITAKH